VTKKTDDKTDKTKLREKIFQLQDQGVASPEIARRLRVPEGTIAAYLAHRTRGTYDSL